MTETRRTFCRKLIPREELAITYIMSGQYTQIKALMKAGYTENTARHNAKQVLSRKPVADELARRRRVALEKNELTEEWIIKRLMILADSGIVMAKFKKVLPNGNLDWDFEGATQAELAVINELTVVTHADAEGNTMTKFKVGHADPKGALDSLARTKGMFQEKVKFEGELSLVDRIIRGRERARIEDETGDN